MEKIEEWYYLDPDNRIESPSVPHCARCKKTVKNTMCLTGFKSITIHYDAPWYKLDPRGKDLIGIDCHKQMVEQYGILT